MIKFFLRKIWCKMYILDKCPELAAKYLTKVQVQQYMNTLEKAFVCFNEENLYYRKACRWVYYSKENYVWYSKFYVALEKLYYKYFLVPHKSVINFNKDYLFKPTRDIPNTSLFFPEPNKVKKARSKFKNSQLFTNDVISNNRILFILKQYPSTSFYEVPVWYKNSSYDVIKGYSQTYKKFTLIKITDGTYKYFYKTTMGSNWVAVENVPLEIKYIIDSIFA